MRDFKDAHEYVSVSKIKLKKKKKNKNENGAKIVIFDEMKYIKFRREIGDAVRSWSV